MVLRAETLRASQFYNEWSRPQNYLSVMGATLLVEDQWRFEFVVPGKNAFGPEQIKLYDALAPHLKRAVQLTTACNPRSSIVPIRTARSTASIAAC